MSHPNTTTGTRRSWRVAFVATLAGATIVTGAGAAGTALANHQEDGGSQQQSQSEDERGEDQQSQSDGGSSESEDEQQSDESDGGSSESEDDQQSDESDGGSSESEDDQQSEESDGGSGDSQEGDSEDEGDGQGGEQSESSDPFAGMEDSSNIGPGFALTDAEIALLNLDTDEEEFVRVTFTQEVQEEPEDASMFFVTGFDPDDRIEATTVRLVEGSTEELLIGFPSDTNLREYAVVGVNAGAVRDSEGDGNIPSTVRLTDGESALQGRTTLPELVDVQVDDSLERVTYRFDEFIDEEMEGSGDDFGYYMSNGEARSGGEIVATEDNFVTVDYSEADGAMVEDAVRFFVKTGAVTDRSGDESNADSVGNDTSKPDLVSVRQEGDTESQYLFTFDEPVKDPEASNFRLYTQSGERFDGETANLRDERVVQVTFPETQDFAGDIRMAVVAAGAVTDLGTDDAKNTIATRSIGGAESGNELTAGPDLIGLRVKPEAGEVTFRFDEELDEDGDFNAGGFHIITDAGDVVEGDTVSVVDDERGLVRVLFSESAVESAVAVVVNPGTVTDQSGTGNILLNRVFSSESSGDDLDTDSRLRGSGDADEDVDADS